MKLVEPSLEFEVSYRGYIAELGDCVRIPFTLTYPFDPFSDLVQTLMDQSRGIGVREGFVANSTFWLLQDQQILGVSNLRHGLTPSLERIGGHIGFGVRPSQRKKGVGTQLLRLTLMEASRRGLTRVLLTCDQDNLGSAGVIKANSGSLENEILNADTGKWIQRYWIDIAPWGGIDESEYEGF